MAGIKEETDPEFATLEDLVEFQERKLQSTMTRAYGSRFYRARWKIAGVNPDQVRSLEDLCLLPFIPRRELFESTRKERGGIASGPVNTWFAGRSPTTPYEWFPFSARDFLGIAPMLGRLSRVVGLKTGDIVLAVVDSNPRISSVIPFMWTYSEVLRFPRLEFITGALDWYDALGMTWIDFIQRRRPTVLFASTENAVALSNKIQDELSVRAREVLTETRVGIFHGEPLADSRVSIMDAYTLEMYETYSPVEHMSFSAECSAHNGIHIWMDSCIPEIIPSNHRDAVPIWQASAGTSGELVITSFAECLPLVRYRTGESIVVESNEACSCGRSHPRIRRLGSEVRPAVSH